MLRHSLQEAKLFIKLLEQERPGIRGKGTSIS